MTSGDDPSLPVGGVHELLAHRERRELLVALHRGDTQLDLETLFLSLEGLTGRTSEADHCCAQTITTTS